jgi:hypothetical protein
MQQISRRGVILGGASAATLAIGLPLRAGARETISVDAFRALSARLTGVDAADLDMAASAKLLDGFLSTGHETALAALIAGGANNGALANEIVAAWYSGSYATVAGPAAFNLPDALLWRALTFTKPPGRCGGVTGYWAEAPEH